MTIAELVKRVRRDLDVERARLFVWDEDDASLHAVGAAGEGAEGLAPGRLERELGQQAATIRSILVVYPQSDPAPAAPAKPTLAAAVAVVHDDVVLGAITAVSARPGRIFTFADRRALLRLASATAAALKGVPTPTLRRFAAEHR